MLIGAGAVSSLQFWGAPYWWAFGVVAFFYAAWEWRQYYIGREMGQRAHVLALDCLLDLSAVAWGATYPLAYGSAWWPAVGLLALGMGWAKRAAR